MNQIFDNFDRSEFSDEIYSIFGRALCVATRFDSSCKALARLSSFKVAVREKNGLSDDEYAKVVDKINKTHKNLARAIDSLKFKGEYKKVLSDARVARNELIHEATLGADMGFDYMNETELSTHLSYVKELVYKVIKGEALISTVISIENKEPISDYPFSELYENQYLNWIMERFDV